MNVLISPGGMAAVYHLSTLAGKYFSGDISIHLCDTNSKHLVAASSLAATFTQVAPIRDRNHKKQLLTLIQKKSIDVFLPMMEQELFAFPCDDPALIRLGVGCISIPKITVPILQNKRSLRRFLSERGIPVPREIRKNEVHKSATYFVKPIDGYGSRGSFQISGKDVKPFISQEKMLVEEFCENPEVTIEVFNTKGLFTTLCRERIETKGGVCTKARVYFDPALERLAKRVCVTLPLPPALCIQVMKNSKKEWVVTDVNPRLGAGTSMATAYGWSLGSALLSHLLHRDPQRFLKRQKREAYVVRTYQDLVMTK